LSDLDCAFHLAALADGVSVARFEAIAGGRTLEDADRSIDQHLREEVYVERPGDGVVAEDLV